MKKAPFLFILLLLLILSVSCQSQGEVNELSSSYPSSLYSSSDELLEIQDDVQLTVHSVLDEGEILYTVPYDDVSDFFFTVKKSSINLQHGFITKEGLLIELNSHATFGFIVEIHDYAVMDIVVDSHELTVCIIYFTYIPGGGQSAAHDIESIDIFNLYDNNMSEANWGLVNDILSVDKDFKSYEDGDLRIDFDALLQYVSDEYVE